MTYVITLDTDTHLPLDAARTFVGTMAHPLNRPVYDATLGRVREGYGILQPRVSMSLPDTRLSRYARLQGGEPGIDPYTRVISDVYQDLFHEGSFIGKGIYDIDAFERSLKGRLPDNRILSHDLLEGCHARAGLLSDVQVFEEYPSRYGADVNRRYLVSTALTLLLLLGWMVFSAPAFWTLMVLGILLIPPMLVSLLDLLRKPEDIGLRQHLATVLHAVGQRFIQAGFVLVTLPHEAFYSIDAILRTHWRLLVTRRQFEEGDDERVHLAMAADVYAVAPHAAAGPGIPAQPAGCTG